MVASAYRARELTGRRSRSLSSIQTCRPSVASRRQLSSCTVSDLVKSIDEVAAADAQLTKIFAQCELQDASQEDAACREA